MGRTINSVFLWGAFAALVIPGSSSAQAAPTLDETVELIQRTVQHSEIVFTGTRLTYEKFDVSGCTVTVEARHDMWGPVVGGTIDSFAFDLKDVDPAAMQVVGGANSDVSLLRVQVTVPVTTTTVDKKSGTTTESRSNIFQVLLKDRNIAERVEAAFAQGAQLCGAKKF